MDSERSLGTSNNATEHRRNAWQEKLGSINDIRWINSAHDSPDDGIGWISGSFVVVNDGFSWIDYLKNADLLLFYHVSRTSKGQKAPIRHDKSSFW